MRHRLLTPTRPDAWALRWAHLARAVEAEAGERALVAISGGADSVLLLHLMHAAAPRVALRAVHVDHGLRGAESDGDVAFVRTLCDELGVELTVRAVELEADASDLERRAREARYRVLCEEARRTGHHAIFTGHHADDQVETLLLRWMRGSELGGLRAARSRTQILGEWPGQPPEERPAGLAPVEVVRPLLTLRATEIRQLLRDRGARWVEDESNRDTRFARNRVRHHLLPALRESAGDEATDALCAFARTVEKLEDDLAERTEHIVWRPSPFTDATRAAREDFLGGSIARADLMTLDRPLARRALWRLLTEGTGRAPTKELVEAVLSQLFSGRTGRHSIRAGWTLVLRASELVLVPPTGELRRRRERTHQLELPYGDSATADLEWWVQLEGRVRLPDGRCLSCEVHDSAAGRPVPRSAHEVELDLDRLPDVSRLWVRTPRPGDRFHPLGGPGRRPLRRFLADSGVPREERDRVLLVGAADRILWVVGLRPCEFARVEPRTARRLRIRLQRGS